MEIKEDRLIYGYDPANGKDFSCLVFRKGNKVIDSLYGEAADYMNSLISALQKIIELEDTPPEAQDWAFYSHQLAHAQNIAQDALGEQED